MNKKIFAFLALVGICLTLFASCSYSAKGIGGIITAQYAFVSASDWSSTSWKVVHPSSSADFSAVDETFNSSYTGRLTLLRVGVGKASGTPSMHMTAYIYGCDNLLNANPNATILATSNTIVVTPNSTYASTPKYDIVDFTFDGTYTLTAGTKYAWVVVVTSVESAGTIGVAGKGSNQYEGYSSVYYSSTWNGPYNDNDNAFEVYVDTDAVATPGPLPTGGSYDTSNTNAVINTLMGYLVPLLLWLLPAGFLGWLTHWEKWPMLIGLAIGGGLCYLFLGTQYVWMVFIVTIGLIGMAYQSVRGGGAEQ